MSKMEASSAARAVFEVVRSVLLWAAAVLGALCIVGFLLAIVLGVRPLVVTSGSMAPSIPTGSLILSVDTPASELQVGHVVTVARPDAPGLVTHRIAAIEPADLGVALTLQGDANQTPDVSKYQVTHASRLVAVIPFAGVFVQAMQSVRGLVAIVALIVALLAVYALPAPRLPRSRRSAGRRRHAGAIAPRRLVNEPVPVPAGAAGQK
ncbi:signal peptidase I [Xylanimonas allomyrinae]|uniref:Signal peptidase I n=1 Tax=Xylanimonas allomyrinae TaxID=2509459 RepID=A0A4P6EN63_9MICO|nr:signal peptidase I [Xylanimonas allomyrinae]QAY64330.1 signal peptidase I [Xylanimonas allomyrinae]